ncbi:c-type cytochrome [Zestomonas carbonaria]|uniref:Cytochrome c4 n=1 Tax=Zestomonas carbonaria TaxID=2762745 RepID=A0A7U7EM21_9GAMM|nr:c-type cytochrome [Pseudomonas carbonaria]CAD5107460.1 Cytochrome c4 [Pseudomonas carbonaria]
MNKLTMMWLAILLLGSAQAWAGAEGRALFEQRCAACHQADASGSAAFKAPNLTGLSADYLRLQLEHFRRGVRGAEVADIEGQIMRSGGAGLSDAQIGQLSQYLAGLPRVAVPRPAQAADSAGAELYAGCVGCHGVQAEGIDQLGAPRLAGQHDWYLKAQLLKYRSGQRGSHADDQLGQQMAAMARGIRDEAAIDTLVRHIASLAVE